MKNLFESGKDFLKDKLKKKIIFTVLPVVVPYLLIIFCALIVVLMFLSPIISALENIGNFGDNPIVNFFQKTANLLSGRGFREITLEAVQEEEKAFSIKLNDYYELYLEHNVELNAPLILATVYYPLSNTYDEGMINRLNNGGSDDSSKEEFDYWRTQTKKLHFLIEYSASEIMREYECDAVTKVGSDGVEKTYYVQGDQVDEVKTYPFKGDFKDSEHCTSESNIKRYSYQLEEEGYDQYLKDEYIPNTPEYAFPDNLVDPERQNKLDQTVISIHDLAELYYDLFEPSYNTAQLYGSIPYNLLQYMVVPLGGDLASNGRANYIITSCFQAYRRLRNGQARAHNGIDLYANNGDVNVRAVADGIVLQANDSYGPNYNCFETQCVNGDARGNYVTIRHEIEGIVFYTNYYHLASVSVNVGDDVKAGTIVGIMGNTGNSSGAHLHFQYNDSNNNPINPGNLFTNPYAIGANAGCSDLSVDCASRNSAIMTSPFYGNWGGNSYPISVTVNGNAPIPLEQYVMGVALNEISADSFHIEAIKAQMIAARTYTFGSERFSSFKVQNNQILINMGVASQNTQTFNLNKFCSLSASNQTKMLQALEDVRGEVLTYNDKMFSSEYSSCSAHSDGSTLGYVYKLPWTGEKVNANCTMDSCGSAPNSGVCGHGRGMSQIGANNYAKNSGYNYTSILSHYYYGSIDNLSNIDLSIYNKDRSR